jgi:uncharacterized protein (TIGR02246 family)
MERDETMSEQEINELVQSWAAAELKGDPDDFRDRDLLHDDFVGVGPVGFVLDKQQWIDRHKGDLRNDEFTVEEPHIRFFGDTAIVEARQTQKTFAMGHETSGSFRIVVVAVKSEGRWRIANIQFSGPLLAPG